MSTEGSFLIWLYVWIVGRAFGDPDPCHKAARNQLIAIEDQDEETIWPAPGRRILKPTLPLEWRGQNGQDEAKQCEHCPLTLGDSVS